MREKEFFKIAKEDLNYNNFDFRSFEIYSDPKNGKDTKMISQSEIIENLIDEAENSQEGNPARDIFVTATTGSGKSIIYQIAAVYIARKYKKMTVIIEPIKALMKDQVESLKERGYQRAAAINSDISYSERQCILQKIKEGEIDIVYISPEMLLLNSAEKLFSDRDIGLFVCDESHIVTLWGEAFRPDYWYLGKYLKKIRAEHKFVICAFTATAVCGGESDTVGEIIESLYMQDPLIILGAVKRNDITFDIRLKESIPLDDEEYSERKATDIAAQMNDWIANGKKGLIYMPYARHVENAYYGVRNFARKEYDPEKIAVYCSRTFEKMSDDDFAKLKEDSFSEFKSGDKKIMVATKAFGMGIDIDDIDEVCHYAVPENLAEYVQEIGRAARKGGRSGRAVMDYYHDDTKYMEQLYTLSKIHEYQVNTIMHDVWELYEETSQKRISVASDIFTYVFPYSRHQDKRDRYDKAKLTLMMIEKDLQEKYNKEVISVEPLNMIEEAYVVIQDDVKDRILSSEFEGYFTKHTDRQSSIVKNAVVQDMGDIYIVDLANLWREKYPDMSYHSFRYWFFHKSSFSPNNPHILKEFGKGIFPRQKIKIKAREEYLLSEIRDYMFQDIDFIIECIEELPDRFTLDEFCEKFSMSYGKNRANMIASNIFGIADPEGKFVNTRFDKKTGDFTYKVKTTEIKARLKRVLKESDIVNLINDIDGKDFELFAVSSGKNNRTALMLFSVFGYISFRIRGLEHPEIVINVEDPQRLYEAVMDDNYKNLYIAKSDFRHNRERIVQEKFFAEDMDNKARWEYIEDYFLGGI